MGAGYREYRPPVGLEPVVACLWENDTLRHRPQPIVPDACVDLVWLGEQEGLSIAGADTGPRIVDPVGVATCGVRLRPGTAGAVLGVPATEIRDLQVPADLVLGDRGARLEDAMMAAEPGRRLRVLTAELLRHRAEPDPIVMAAARHLRAPGVRVTEVAAEIGLSERQLHRRMQNAVGYGPKTLARVARLRRLIALPDDSLATRALNAGYASQAHMNEEVRRLTGATPVRFLKDAALTAA